MPRKVKYTPVQIAEGKWYRIRGYTHHECCDCALVHKEEYRMNDGHVEWRAMRDDAQTAKRRKELGIKVSREA
jgi:transcription initiation factor TFIIIB Brf1 subunit/transcription initiation factor TFIIB